MYFLTQDITSPYSSGLPCVPIAVIVTGFPKLTRRCSPGSSFRAHHAPKEEYCAPLVVEPIIVLRVLGYENSLKEDEASITSYCNVAIKSGSTK